MGRIKKKTPLASISYTSILVSLAFLCQLANYAMLRDGLSMWNFYFVQKTDFIYEIKIVLLIQSSIAMIIGAIIYNAFSIKLIILALLSLGVVIGNSLIIGVDSHHMKPFADEIQGKVLFGYRLAFACIGASLPFLIDYCFSHIPDNKSYEKSVSVFAGFVFLFWIIAQLFSFRALLSYQLTSDGTYWMPITPLILSMIVFVLLVIAVVVDLFQKENGRPPKLKKKYAVCHYYITVGCALFSAGIFYFFKEQLVPLWLDYGETKVGRHVGGVAYTSDTLSEQYLYFMVFSWFLFKLIFFRNAKMGPLLGLTVAICLAIYTLFLSYSTTTLAEQRYTNRFIYPDYNNNKMVFINLRTEALGIQFSYAKFKGSTIALNSSASNFVIDRLQHHFVLKRNDISYFQFVYMATIKLEDWGPMGKIPCHGSYNKWNCPQILASVSHDLNLATWTKQINREAERSVEDAHCPVENMYHKSSLYAYACLRIFVINSYKPIAQKLNFVNQNGRRYSLLPDTKTTTNCHFLPAGNYSIESIYKPDPVINLDVFEFSPGGSYFVFVSMYHTINDGRSQICYNQSVAFHKVWQKPLTMSVLFLLPQFIMMAIAEMLLFTSCLQFIYSRRDQKSHPFLLAFLFFFIQFGFIWHLSFPTDGYSIFSSSKLWTFVLLLLFCTLLICIIKYLQMNLTCLARLEKKSEFLAEFRKHLESLYRSDVQMIGEWRKMVLKYFARDYEKAVKYGMCPDESDDEDRARAARAMERKEDKSKSKPPPPAPSSEKTRPPYKAKQSQPPPQSPPPPPPSPSQLSPPQLSPPQTSPPPPPLIQTPLSLPQSPPPPPLPPPPPPPPLSPPPSPAASQPPKAKPSPQPKAKPSPPLSSPPQSSPSEGTSLSQPPKAKPSPPPKAKSSPPPKAKPSPPPSSPSSPPPKAKPSPPPSSPSSPPPSSPPQPPSSPPPSPQLSSPSEATPLSQPPKAKPSPPLSQPPKAKPSPPLKSKPAPPSKEKPSTPPSSSLPSEAKPSPPPPTPLSPLSPPTSPAASKPPKAKPSPPPPTALSLLSPPTSPAASKPSKAKPSRPSKAKSSPQKSPPTPLSPLSPTESIPPKAKPSPPLTPLSLLSPPTSPAASKPPKAKPSPPPPTALSLLSPPTSPAASKPSKAKPSRPSKAKSSPPKSPPTPLSPTASIPSKAKPSPPPKAKSSPPQSSPSEAKPSSPTPKKTRPSSSPKAKSPHSKKKRSPPSPPQSSPPPLPLQLPSSSLSLLGPLSTLLVRPPNIDYYDPDARTIYKKLKKRKTKH